MSLTNTYTFEEGTDGASVTTACGAASVGGSPVYSAAGAFHGAMGVLLTGSSTDRLDFSAGASGQFSIYVNLASSSGTNCLIWGIMQSTSYQARCRFNTNNGKFELADASSSTLATSTISYVIGQPVRLDVRYDGSSGSTMTMTMQIFVGANVEGSTPDDTLSSGSFAIPGTPSAIRLTCATPGWSSYYDTLRLYDDMTTWPTGYASPSLPPLPWRSYINSDASLTQNLVAKYDFNANTSDLSGQGNNAIPQGPLTLTSGHKGAANSAYAFDGTSAYLSTTNQITNPQNYSMNVWFKITGTTGGNLIGFCNTQVTAPSNYDRIMWVDTAGHVSWGVYTGSVFYITSTGTYNDGNWHMATATMSTASGMALYVDGTSAATNANTVSQTYNGWWRLGQNNTAGGWPTPAGTLFSGTMDDVSIYSVTLSATQVAELYTI